MSTEKPLIVDPFNAACSKPTRAIAIMAHGSRAQAANSEFLCVIDAMRAQLMQQYDQVAGVFLELCEPSLMTQACEWAEAGIQEIDVYPMFFNRGKHVGRDIPKQISDIIEKYPSLTLQQLSYLGNDQRFSTFMAEHILAQTYLWDGRTHKSPQRR